MSETNRGGFHELTLNGLRIVAGFLFMQHGAQKLFGWLDGNAVESWTSQRGLAGLLEFFGGILMVAGLFTRPLAFLLSGEMAFAYFMRHAPRGFWPITNGGELAAFYCFTWLFFFMNGGGSFSVDGWLSSRRDGAPITTK